MVLGIFALGVALFGMTMVIFVFRRFVGNVFVAAVVYRFFFFFLGVISCDCVCNVMEEAPLFGLLPPFV